MSGWKPTPLSAVATVFNGKTPSKVEQRSAGHPVLKIKDVSELGEFRGPFESFVDPEFAEKHYQKRVRDGDTLILNAAHNADYVASKTFKASPPTFGSLATGEWLTVRPDNAKLHGGFAYYWVNHPRTRRALRDLVNGIHLYPKDVARLSIPLPPLAEQRRIAAILDQAEALRAKRRHTLAQLDTLTHSLFLDMFGDPAANPKGWPLSSLGELTSKFSDGPFGSNLKTSHYTETGVRVIRLQNIGVGEFIDRDRAYISTKHFSDLAKHECLPGDVLIGTLGDPNLRACVQPPWLPVALNKADCVQARPDPRTATSEYLCALLNQPSTEQLAQGLILGQTRLRISMGRLRGLFVPAPPLTLQSQFSNQVAAVQKLKTTHRASLAKLDALFASLQHRAFRGEL